MTRKHFEDAEVAAIHREEEQANFPNENERIWKRMMKLKNGLDVAKREALHDIAYWALTRHRDAIGDHFALTDDEVQELFDFLVGRMD
tara:strand:- start:487 stop:750 length:264 start_codon:yes stop_codon:yes gene_type:complete